MIRAPQSETRLRYGVFLQRNNQKKRAKCESGECREYCSYARKLRYGGGELEGGGERRALRRAVLIRHGPTPFLIIYRFIKSSRRVACQNLGEGPQRAPPRPARPRCRTSRFKYRRHRPTITLSSVSLIVPPPPARPTDGPSFVIVK
ncbi:hypothetical protein EVAR_98149_1 [Eumeta japonica]|uniref:Uncharacterized protein n=1 Tax=Eumeta variegata TaxID=151549 RepID=A0A4C1XPV5_EUMVA|nr:hypothetical protein EVAR_98149_1 [Eumeta japonica]